VSGVNHWNGPVQLPDLGEATIGGSSGTLHIGGIVSGSASFLIISGATIVLEAANTYAGSTSVLAGELRVANASGSATGTSDVAVFSPGRLSGTGAIAGHVFVEEGAWLLPGASTGILSVGQLDLHALSTTVFEIGGLTPGTGHDQVQVGSQVLFGGALHLQLLNGFVPALGDEFVLFTYSSSVGTFSGTDLPALPAGLEWAFEYGPTSMRARVQLMLDAESAPPTRFALHVPVPNPSLRSAVIRFELPVAGTVSIVAYDVAGREAACVLDAVALPAGRHSAPLRESGVDGRGLAPGTYFLRLLVDGRQVAETRTLQRLR
jgi:autotransporter-associated beta strand protein